MNTVIKVYDIVLQDITWSIIFLYYCDCTFMFIRDGNHKAVFPFHKPE